MAEKILKIYEDEALKKEIEEIDLGTVEAGKVIEKTFWLSNISNGIVSDLEFKIDSSLGVVVLESPTSLIVGDVGILKIRWSAPLDLRKGLKSRVEMAFKVTYE